MKGFDMKLFQYLSGPPDQFTLQTAGNFVTAFYGIFNPVNNEFIYANAGHNSPYLIDNKKFEFLDISNRGMPLGINQDENEIQSDKIKYTNKKIILRTDSKLFFYTDGLTEAVNIHEKSANPGLNDFESTKLTEILTQNSDKTAQEFVHEILNKLVLFRGTKEFDDDICMDIL